MMIKKNPKTPTTLRTFVVMRAQDLPREFFSKKEQDYIEEGIARLQNSFCFDRLGSFCRVECLTGSSERPDDLEKARLAGDKLQLLLDDQRHDNELVDLCPDKALFLAFVEAYIMGAYRYAKHTQLKAKSAPHFSICSSLPARELHALDSRMETLYWCRDLVNTPACFQSAKAFAESLCQRAATVGVKATVLDKKQIESQRMGGLLGVNRGSTQPPTFTLLEWNPTTAKKQKPLVLVGKGLVFDAGGMNLKTGDYMNDMKQDMAGGALVAAALISLAAMSFPRPLVALIPSTDNRLNGDALVPGDVLLMRSGLTVEVDNTDAEGRLILADALDFAKGFSPELVIDVATLTGSASRATGKHGIVAMQSRAEEAFAQLKASGEYTRERIVEFPLWDEYAEELRSEVADYKNCGSAYAGAITAGKFLTLFTDYPYIHLDIAGVAFADRRYKYYGTNATAFGLRLLTHFIQQYKPLAS